MPVPIPVHIEALYYFSTNIYQAPAYPLVHYSYYDYYNGHV